MKLVLVMVMVLVTVILIDDGDSNGKDDGDVNQYCYGENVEDNDIIR